MSLIAMHSNSMQPDWVSTASIGVNWPLLTQVLILMTVGFVMVASASMAYAEFMHNDAWFYVKRHMIWLVLAMASSIVVASIPMAMWQRYGSVLLVLALLLLVMVLIPGLGKRVNGSQRWLQLGPFTLQASEAAKFCMIVFFASFLSRRRDEVLAGWRGIMKPLLVLGAVVFLMLLEPDFGGSVVLAGTVMALLFIAGVKMRYYLTLAVAGVGMLMAVVQMADYRIQRLKTYLDPWADENVYGSGYQLTQSLIAFGRGEWAGLGLGNSVQKLFYLPEAHTDFIFAVIAEELGLIGAVVVIGVFVAMVVTLLRMSKRAMAADVPFAAYVAFGVAVMFAGQIFINVGVASGLLPTKGLTLPFISYGGSSLLVSTAFIALLLRLDFEVRQQELKSLQPKKSKRARKTAHEMAPKIEELAA